MKRLFLLIIPFFVSSYLFGYNKIISDSIPAPFLPDTISKLIMDRAEVMPSFPGGATALMKFISGKLNYPPEARDAGYEGKVVVKFYVDTDGSVKEPVVLRNDGCQECSEEVLKLVRKLPNWSPGTYQGKPVKVYYTLPINFSLGNAMDLNNKNPICKEDEITFQNKLTEGMLKTNSKKKVPKTMSIVFTVSETGTVSNVSIEPSDSISQQQIDKIKKLMEESKWYPAVKNGKIVTASHSINLNY